MTVKGIKPCERLPTTLAYEWTMIGVQLLVALAVMLSCEALATPWPLAVEGFFIIV
jgi:hypothetical protein